LSPERWEQIEKLYHTALEKEPGLRSAFLDEACAGDDSLRREVESLLAYAHRAENFIESPAIEMAATMLAEEQAGAAIGMKAGPFEILSLLGAGGMGEVYLAEDTRLGRKVALKLLPKELTQDLERVRRFEQEARAVSALNHPNILTIYDIGRVEDVRYIATEYIQGQTLRQEMTAARLELRKALDVGCQVASALSAAHEAEIVHRDIKPENIMLRRDGYVKVLDFGLAKLAKPRGLFHSSDAQDGVSTEIGIVLGTVNYMSPEQARGLSLDVRSDIFSFGVVLYEMIAGRLPFAGATSADVIASILEREPPALPQRVAPEPLEWIIGKALRKERDERYQTARELLSDLKGLQRRLEFQEELERSKDEDQTTVVMPPHVVHASPGSDSAERRSRNPIDSLAILPLTNTTADPSMEYFSDGITETIIDTLSRLPDLRVMAWSTVSNYRNQQIDPREIGKSLRVRAVLTGRVVQLDDRLVIKTELVDATDGSRLWGENYRCRPSDVMEVEAEISREISEKLLVRLTTEERRRLAKSYT
jgi:serine/threonine protein kinase